MNKLLNVACNNDPAFCPNSCGHSYRGIARKCNLKRHLKYYCGMHPKFQCIVCHKTYREKESLNYHMFNVGHS